MNPIKNFSLWLHGYFEYLSRALQVAVVVLAAVLIGATYVARIHGAFLWMRVAVGVALVLTYVIFNWLFVELCRPPQRKKYEFYLNQDLLKQTGIFGNSPSEVHSMINYGIAVLSWCIHHMRVGAIIVATYPNGDQVKLVLSGLAEAEPATTPEERRRRFKVIEGGLS